MAGTLTVVGAGIESVGHITLEAAGWIASADKVLYLVVDPVTAAWIKTTAKRGSEPEDLKFYYPDYSTNDYPVQISDAVVANIANRIAYWVNQEINVCAVFYGHPGMLVHPAHMVMTWARDQKLGRMIPGISALDCLFADLNVNPGDTGFQMFEAWNFVDRFYQDPSNSNQRPQPTLDPYCHVVIWEIGLMGQNQPAYGLQDLYNRLSTYYEDGQPIVHYQRPQLPMFTYVQSQQQLTLHDLPGLGPATNGASTLYIFPKGPTTAPTVFTDQDAGWTPGPVPPIPTTPGDPPAKYTQVYTNLSNLAQNPQQLNACRQNRQLLVAGSGLDPTQDADDIRTLTGDDMRAIFAKLKSLIPVTQVKYLTSTDLQANLQANGQQLGGSLAQAITDTASTTAANAVGSW